MKFKLTGQNIKVVESLDLTKGTVNTGGIPSYYAEFEFDETWDGFTKTVIFDADTLTSPILVVLDSTNKCIIPHEVLANAGSIRVGVKGNKSTNVYPSRLSTDIQVDGSLVSGQPGVNPTPEIYSQIVTLATWTKNAVENATGSVTMVSSSTPASVDVSIVNNHMNFGFKIPTSGGGGGGNGVYNIVFTMDDDEDITCDKAFDEVLAARQSGMVVVGKMNIPNIWSSEYSVDGHLPLTAYVEDTNHNKWLEFSGASSKSIYDNNTITSTTIRWYKSSSGSSEHIYFNVACADREILGTVDSFVDLRYETTSTDDDASDDGALLTQAIYGKQVLVYFANDWFTVKVPLTFTDVTTLSDAYNTKIYSGESLYRVPYTNGEWTKYKSMRLTLTLTTTTSGSTTNYLLTTKTEELKSTSFYTVQVPNTGWTQDATAGWYTKSVTVTGMLSTDNPVVDIDLSSAVTASAITSLLTDWAKILRISTSANTITLYASSVISQAITLKLQVTR